MTGTQMQVHCCISICPLTYRYEQGFRRCFADLTNRGLIMSTTQAICRKIQGISLLNLSVIVIHSKYFPDSDWLKAHA